MGTNIGISLMLFTALAPAGAFAFCLIAVLVIATSKDWSRAERLAQFSVIPLVICMLGLLISATHLGTPSNALYVLGGVGRSPLSNEVFSACVFLGLAWMYWLVLFASKMRSVVVNAIWLIATCVAACWFVSQTALAYSIETVPPWDSPLVPYALASVALSAAPALAILSISASGVRVCPWLLASLIALSVVAMALAVVIMNLQDAVLDQCANAYETAADLVPGYRGNIAAFAACVLVSNTLTGIVLWRRSEISLQVALIACVIVFIGIIFVRVPFYTMHLTVGL